MLFDPRIIFILIWSVELIAQFLFGGIFGSFATETWLSISITIIAFLLGAQLIQLKVNSSFIEKNYLFKNIESFFNKDISSRFIYVTLFILVTTVVFAIQKLLLITGVDGEALRPAECLRLQIIKDLISSREIAPIIKLFTFGIAICIFYLSNLRNSTKFQTYFIIVLGIFFVFATTGRLMLLMLFGAITYLLYVQKIWRFKEVILSIISFALLFFMIALVLNKQTADWSKNINPCTNKNCIVQEINWSNEKKQIINQRTQTGISKALTIQDKLIWNAQNYLLGSLGAFNHFVTTGSPRIDGGATLPNAIRKVINLSGLDIKMRPAVNPFVITPLQSNTYTAIFPIYHDMGKLGVFIWFFILGILHQFLYKLTQYSTASIYKYLYAISIYPLCMIIFEEAYISSLGFWMIFLATPVLLQSLNIGWAKLQAGKHE